MMTTTQNAPAIEIDGVHKRYGSLRAVDGIDLTITLGEVVALLGPNGAGKTTMLDILLGLRDPDAGQVRITGTSIREAIDGGVIGAVLQEGELLPGVTVRELLTTMSALQPNPLPLEKVIEQAELGELLGKRTEKLSGGQAQRVRFALSLVGDPKILVLDEPTAAMDVTARRSFWAGVRDLAAAGRTVVFSTHYLEEADAIADRIVLLAAGKVRADGPTTEIRAVAAARTVRFTLAGADADALRTLPNVSGVEVHGSAVTLRTADSDATVRALLADHPDARDIEVVNAPLADAVLELTGDEEPAAEDQPTPTGAA